MDDSLTVVFNNSETGEQDNYQFESILYGVMDQNPDAEIFYDVKPGSDARKAEVEAYMAEALEEDTVYGHLDEYGDEPLLRTANVLSEPEIQAEGFDAGPVRPDGGELEEREDLGQEVPDDIPRDFLQGESMHQRASRDERFAEYVVENAADLSGTVVVKEAPTSVVTELEDLDVRVHRANDQLVSQKQLKKMSSFGSEYTELQERSQDF